MPFPLLPLAVASMVAAAYHQTSKPSAKGVMTPTRQYIFEAAMNSTKDPVSLRKLASTFREEGLSGPAEILEKRAKLRELSPETKAARKAVYKKAMASTDAVAIRSVADAFEREGATGAAASLREYAASLPPAPAPSPASAAPVAPIPIVIEHAPSVEAPAHTEAHVVTETPHPVEETPHKAE